ncbi:MAG: ribonuclease P protein component [Alphaproteobacteria bacterium]|nr:ribonuclease P protein component [Alphaproteobacteria bacterium]
MAIAVGRLRARPEYLRVAAGGRKWAAPGLVLQARRSPEMSPTPSCRLGLTASRKVGGAVVRNRARRRLREAARAVLPEAGQAGFDYVLIARDATPARPFALLVGDLRAALAAVHRPRHSA